MNRLHYKISIAEQGFSLIEIMIGLILSLLVIGSIFLLYLSHQAIYREQNGLSRLQENARLASYLFEKTIHTAGYIGCGKLSPTMIVTNHLTDYDSSINQNNNLIGYAAIGTNWQPFLPLSLNKLARPGSDIITVRHLKEDTITDVLTDMQTRNTIEVSNSYHFKEGDIVLIADCQHAEITRIKSVTTSSTKKSLQLKLMPVVDNLYPQPAVIGKLAIESLFVADTTRQNTRGKPIFALYVQDIDGVKTELITGIELLKINYGLPDVNRHREAYLTADWINAHKQWAKVNAVAISMLVSSIEPVASYKLPYIFADKPYAGEDSLLRHQWDIQLFLRER